MSEPSKEAAGAGLQTFVADLHHGLLRVMQEAEEHLMRTGVYNFDLLAGTRWHRRYASTVVYLEQRMSWLGPTMERPRIHLGELTWLFHRGRATRAFGADRQGLLWTDLAGRRCFADVAQATLLLANLVEVVRHHERTLGSVSVSGLEQIQQLNVCSEGGADRPLIRNLETYYCTNRPDADEMLRRLRMSGFGQRPTVTFGVNRSTVE